MNEEKETKKEIEEGIAELILFRKYSPADIRTIVEYYILLAMRIHVGMHGEIVYENEKEANK